MKRPLLLIFIFQINLLQAQVEAFQAEIFGTFLSVRDLNINSQEQYFTIQSLQNEISAIALIKNDKGVWGAAEIAPFSGQYSDLEAFLSPDGLRLYFASNRPVHPDSTQVADYNIWYVERKTMQDKWSKAICLDSPVNSSDNEFYPAIVNSGRLYFTSDRSGGIGSDDLYVADWNGEVFSEVICLDSAINSSGYEYNAFVDPDEKLLIFGSYNRKDGYGSGDLYISKKDVHGNWEIAKNMGPEVNSNKMDYCPFYCKSDSTLYFTSKRSSVENDPSLQKDLSKILRAINQYDNGLSRIYKLKINL